MNFYDREPKLLEIHVFMARRVGNMKNILSNNVKMLNKLQKITKIVKIKQLKMGFSVFKLFN